MSRMQPRRDHPIRCHGHMCGGAAVMAHKCVDPGRWVRSKYRQEGLTKDTPDLSSDHDITPHLAERLITALEELIAAKVVPNALSTSEIPHSSIQTPPGSPVVPEQSETPQRINNYDIETEPGTLWQGFKEIKEVSVPESTWKMHADGLLFYCCSWNEKAYQYEIAEPTKQSSNLGELDGYIFVVRQRVG